MLKKLIKQSFLASLAASLSGLIVFYVLGFWFLSNNHLNVLEFLGITLFIMPFFTSIFLVIFAIRFLSDFYKEYPTIMWWKTALFLFSFTFLTLIVIDQSFFLITDDIPKAVVRVYYAIDAKETANGEKTTSQMLEEEGESIEDIGKYAPWVLNWVTLLIFLFVASLLSHNRLKRITKPKESNYR